MRGIRVAVATFLFGSFAFAAAPVPSACAAEGAHAVLVVDTEQTGGQFRYCVALPDGSVSGLELIRLAHEQHGLDYRLGYGGNAVCVLAGVGYESDECLKEGPEFWGYWRGNGSGGWTWSSTGANGTTVSDGDVDGWSWGTGNDGASHPQPPRTTFASVCGDSSEEPADPDGGEPRKKQVVPEASEDRAGASEQAAVAAGGSDADEVVDENDRKNRASEKRERSQRGRNRDGNKRHRVALDDTASPEPSPPAGAVEQPSTSGGPPIGGVVAAAAIGGCLAGGFLLQRRRRRVS